MGSLIRRRRRFAGARRSIRIHLHAQARLLAQSRRGFLLQARPARSCATSASHPKRSSRTASWPPWTSSTDTPSSILGPINSITPLDMISNFGNDELVFWGREPRASVVKPRPIQTGLPSLADFAQDQAQQVGDDETELRRRSGRFDELDRNAGAIAMRPAAVSLSANGCSVSSSRRHMGASFRARTSFTRPAPSSTESQPHFANSSSVRL